MVSEITEPSLRFQNHTGVFRQVENVHVKLNNAKSSKIEMNVFDSCLA